ncbi:hypothetical protein NE634_00535 [Lacrimispora saccharolytica]|nr:hypothetical protein [Lacrimispora saccharolytica]
MKKYIARIIEALILSLLIMVGIQQPYNIVQAASGALDYGDGDRYVGKYDSVIGDKNGKGKYYCADGTVISGVWSNDFLKGKAREVERDGFRKVLWYGIAFYKKECIVRKN